MNKKYKPIWSFPIFSRSRMIKQPHVMREFCRKDVAGLPPSAASIYRKDIFNNVDKFKHSEGAECDVRVAMRLLDICDVYYYHRYLFVFRNHDMRSFDIQKETRSSTIFAKVDNFFRILHDIYRTRYGNSDAYRYILQATVLPTLCNVNLYLIYGRFKTIIQVYKSCFSHFPDILRRLEDWYPFMRIQLYLVKRGLTMYRIPTSIKQQVRWLEYMGDL